MQGTFYVFNGFLEIKVLEINVHCVYEKCKAHLPEHILPKQLVERVACTVYVMCLYHAGGTTCLALLV